MVLGRAKRRSSQSQSQSQPQSQTPVGVTIAYKRKQQGSLSTPPQQQPQPYTVENVSSSYYDDDYNNEKDISSEKQQKSNSPNTANKKHNSLWVLVEGAALYAACLVLPTAVGFVVRAFEDGWISLSLLTNLLATVTQNPEQNQTVEESSLSGMAYQQAAYYFCENQNANADSISTLSYYIGSNWSWCPQPINTNNDYRNVSPISPDAQSTDFAYVAMMSLTLAVIRVAVVHFLVPTLTDVEGIQAWVRCKSVHLLSADYSATLTPTTNRMTLDPTALRLAPPDAQSAMLVPNLNHDTTTTATTSIGLDFDDAAGDTTHSSSNDRDDLAQRRHSFQESESNLPEPSRLFQDISSRLQEQSQAPKSRLHAAPRYATAVFRLVYCTITISMAFLYFKDANFWPWYVGGQGATKHCWDLSGGLAHVLDSDFDQRNRALKSYFLWQASYHWHSGAFHVLSMLILVLKPRHQEAPRRFLTLTAGSTAYMRSLLQHILSLAMISTAYIFSSLRRLVTIGMFAFDISSWCLHLLQVCMNAPEDSRLSRPVWIRKLHKFVVLVFGLTRFGIWPALWVSSAYESQSWLQQLDQTIIPSAGLAMRIVMNVLFLLLMILTLVYGRRLCKHPHLGRIAQCDVDDGW